VQWRCSCGTRQKSSERPYYESNPKFLFQLGHADIALGLVVIKRNLKIIHKCQHHVRVISQSIQQVLGGVCLARPRLWACSSVGSGGGLASNPSATIWSYRFWKPANCSGEKAAISGLGRLPWPFGFPSALVHSFRPGLLVILHQIGQFAYKMGATQTMFGLLVRQIGLPEIVDAPPVRLAGFRSCPWQPPPAWHGWQKRSQKPCWPNATISTRLPACHFHRNSLDLSLGQMLFDLFNIGVTRGLLL